MAFVLVASKRIHPELQLLLANWDTSLRAQCKRTPRGVKAALLGRARKSSRPARFHEDARTYRQIPQDGNSDNFDPQKRSVELTMASPWLAVASRKQRKIILAGFSVTRAVFKQITESFQQVWLSRTGEKVVFGLSFAGSGVQSRAIRDGLPAHVCCLALADDVEKLVRLGYIQSNWRDRVPNRGIVARSITVVASRLPKEHARASTKFCEGFTDILSKNLAVITANPKSAGAARWNFLGLWSAARSGSIPFDEEFIRNAIRAKQKPENADLLGKLEGDPDWIAFAFLKEVYLRAPLLPRDGRDATDVFIRQELGDVLITYENEAILSKMRGLALDYRVPLSESNCLIEFPISVVDQNAVRENVEDVVHAFVDYCFGEEAQQILTEYGFRPASDAVLQKVRERFPEPPMLETVDGNYGGWSAVMQKFFVPGAVFDILFEQVARELSRRRKKQNRWSLGKLGDKVPH
jgi:ABC-type sulfate transport system substrate-binding protein